MENFEILKCGQFANIRTSLKVAIWKTNQNPRSIPFITTWNVAYKSRNWKTRSQEESGIWPGEGMEMVFGLPTRLELPKMLVLYLQWLKIFKSDDRIWASEG
jgi:hypothetical protein